MLFRSVLLLRPRRYGRSAARAKPGVAQPVHILVSDAGARVYPAGRLDLNSEGLLLMTNDGDFAHRVMHPSHNITKTYEVCARGDIEAAAKILRRPMEIDSHTVHAVSVRLAKSKYGRPALLVEIREGRNRQIRKMCAECGLEVLSLKRISVGKLTLGTLKTGKWRRLTEEEVELFWGESGEGQ